MSRAAASISLVCFVALAVAGCSSSSGGSGGTGGSGGAGSTGGSATSPAVGAGATSAAAAGAAGAAKDPCTLVTAADIASVTGLTVAAPHTNDAGVSKLCAYSYDSTGDDDFNIGITMVTDPESQSDFQADQSLLDATSVSGVGGAAYWADDKGQLYVWQNGEVFEVGVTGDNDKVADDNAQSTATSLAKIAVTRL